MIYPDYNNSILNTISSILKYYKVDTKYNTHKELDDILTKNYKNIIFLVLDGLGNNILNNISKDGFFEKNKIKTVTSVYPSTTTAALTTYYSGQPPYETGWVAWSQYFKEYGRCIDMFSEKESYEQNILPKTKLKDVFKDVVNYESVFEKIEKSSKDVKAIEITPSYSSVRARKSLRADNVEEAIEAIKLVINGDERKFIFTYIDSPDALLHKYGCTSEEVRKFVLETEEKIKVFSEKLNDTLIIVTADHGHKDVEKVYTSIDDEYLFDTYLMPPALESRAVAYYIKPDRKDDFVKKFNELYGNEFMLLSREEVLEKGLLGYGNKHKRLDDFLGDFMALSIGSSIIRLTNYLAEGKTPKKSTHCGLTEDEMLVPLICIERK